jgi:hypothetical protein
MLVGGLETREGPSAAGTWQGQPRSLYRTAHGGTGPLPRGEGGSGPSVAGCSSLARDGPAITRSGPGPPGESGPAGATREPSCPPGCAEAPDLLELREGPETVVPAVRPG